MSSTDILVTMEVRLPNPNPEGDDVSEWADWTERRVSRSVAHMGATARALSSLVVPKGARAALRRSV